METLFIYWSVFSFLLTHLYLNLTLKLKIMLIAADKQSRNKRNSYYSSSIVGPVQLKILRKHGDLENGHFLA